MKVNYYPETDSLYIDLSEKPNPRGGNLSYGFTWKCHIESDKEPGLAT